MFDMQTSTNTLCTALRGVAGVFGSAVAYLGVTLDDVEPYLQVTSFVLGAIVAVLTIIKLSRDLTRKQ